MMLGDGKRKRSRKQAEPDAEAGLAEAERLHGVARQHLAALRHRARTAHSEIQARQAAVDAELRAAGLKLREPRSADEMQVEVQRCQWELHALEAQITGAERAVSAAEGAVGVAMLGAYPSRSKALDLAAEKLVARRERAEAELAALAALEAEHRDAWARLLACVPGNFVLTFVPKEFLDVRHSQGTEIPRTLTPTWRPERGEGLNSALAIDESWPRWFQDAVEQMQQQPADQGAPITQTAAVFEEAGSCMRTRATSANSSNAPDRATLTPTRTRSPSSGKDRSTITPRVTTQHTPPSQPRVDA